MWVNVFAVRIPLDLRLQPLDNFNDTNIVGKKIGIKKIVDFKDDPGALHRAPCYYNALTHRAILNVEIVSIAWRDLPNTSKFPERPLLKDIEAAVHKGGARSCCAINP